MLKTHCQDTSPGEYFGCDVAAVNIAPTRHPSDFSPYLRPAPDTRIDEWGIGWKAGGPFHYEQILHPLQALPAQAVQDYPFPDLDADYRYVDLPAQVAAIRQRGLAVAAYPGSVFECAWHLRGMTELFADIAQNPAIAEFLLDQITNRVAGAARRLAVADIDLLILGDDIATQRGLLMSLPMWRQLFKPRLQHIIRAAKEVKPDLLIFYHSDGNVWDAIPDLIEAGVEVLNPVQPECMNPAEVKRTFGDRLAFFGTIGIQQTLPHGTPAQVRAEVQERIETVGAQGGLLLAPSHVLQPDIPWENVVALFEAVEEFGYYNNVD
jgi:uroporphyrinogen decarboxylase